MMERLTFLFLFAIFGLGSDARAQFASKTAAFTLPNWLPNGPDDKSGIARLYSTLESDFERNPYFKKETQGDPHVRDGRVPDWQLQQALSHQGKPTPAVRERVQRQLQKDNGPFDKSRLNRILEFQMLDPEVFELAMEGALKIMKSRPDARRDCLTVVDFDKADKFRRLYVFDLKKGAVRFNTYTNYGSGTPTLPGDKERGNPLKSDGSIPDHFSNREGSRLSSLGFFLTDRSLHVSPAWGTHALRVHGIDGSLNSNAWARAILFHKIGNLGERYVADGSNIKTTEGCFGLNSNEPGKFFGNNLFERPLAEYITDWIKGGCIVFAFSSKIDPKTGQPYLKASRYIDFDVGIDDMTFEPTQVLKQKRINERAANRRSNR